MKRVRWDIVFLLLSGMTGCSGSKERNITESTTVRITEESLDLGNVTFGKTREMTFVLENTGHETLQIKNVIPSCDCTTLAYRKEFTEPGDTAHIVLVFKTETPGDFYRTAEIQGNFSEPITLTFTGTVSER